jgi:hypothetical protein
MIRSTTTLHLVRGMRTDAHGRGELAGHWGGRYIWQLSDSADLIAAWKVTLARTLRSSSPHL